MDLFFVLSGFLITGILLVCKEDNHTTNDLFFSLKQFYIRRFLRIFPLYYFVLFVAFFLNIANIRETFFWYAAYLSNIRFAIDQHWAESLSHFWSLAVEEQFYLLWPFVIFFCPRKNLPYVTVVAVLIAPLTRWIAFTQGNNMAVGVLMPSNLDALGLGGLLALLEKGYIRLPSVKNNLIVGTGVTGGLVAVGLQIASNNGRPLLIYGVLFTLFLGLLYFWLVWQASHGFGGLAGKILEARSITYLGKISYGIYVYHNFVPSLVQNYIDPYINLPSPFRGAFEIMLSTGITILIASLSWHILESPLNNLRRYFKYDSKFVLRVSENT